MLLSLLHSLFLWHQPAATRKIYINIWVFFIASLVLPNSYVVTMIGQEIVVVVVIE